MAPKRIRIDLEVNSKKAVKNYKRGTDKMIKDTKKLEKQAKKSTGAMVASFKKLAGVLAAAFAVKAIASATQNLIDYGDRLQKLSIQLGTTTEFLDKLGHVAELGGASMEQASTAIKFLQKNLVDAADGTKEAIDAFDTLGLSIEDLMRMSPEEQFLAVAEAIESIKDPAIRTNTRLALLGRAGNELAPIFKDLRKQLSETSSVMDKKMTDSMAEFNDNITKLKRSLSQNFAVALLPMIKNMNDWVEANQNLINQDLPKYIKSFADAIVAVTKKTVDYIKYLDDWVLAIAAVKADMLDFTKFMFMSKEELKEWAKEFRSSREALNKFNEDVLGGARAIQYYMGEIRNMEWQIDQLIKQRQELSKRGGTLLGKSYEIKEITDRIRTLQKEIEQREKYLDSLQEEYIALQKLKDIKVSDIPAPPATRPLFLSGTTKQIELLKELTVATTSIEEAARLYWQQWRKVEDQSMTEYYAKAKADAERLKEAQAAAAEELAQVKKDKLIEYLEFKGATIAAELERAQQAYDADVDRYKKMLKEKIISQEKFDEMVAISERNRQAAFDVTTKKAAESARTLHDSLVEYFENISASTKEYAKEIASMVEQTIDRTASAMSDSILDYINDINNAEDAFDDFMRTVLEGTAKMLIQMGAQLAMQNMINAALSNANYGAGGGGGGGGGGFWGGLIGAIGGMFGGGGGGSSIPYIPAAQHGGIVSGPKSGYPAMLHGTEAVIPLNKLGAMGGFTQINNITVEGGGSKEDQQKQAKIISEMIDMKTRRTIYEERRIGGILNRAR